MDEPKYEMSADERRVIELEARAKAASGARNVITEKVKELRALIRAQEATIAEAEASDANHSRDPGVRLYMQKVLREARLNSSALKARLSEWAKHESTASDQAGPLVNAANEIRGLFDEMQDENRRNALEEAKSRGEGRTIFAKDVQTPTAPTNIFPAAPPLAEGATFPRLATSIYDNRGGATGE